MKACLRLDRPFIERVNGKGVAGKGSSLLTAAGLLSSLPCGPLHGAARVTSQHGSWLPPEQAIPERARRKSSAFYDLVLEIIYHQLCHILFTRSESLNIVHSRERQSSSIFWW